jgi:preprotein translocase subunit SecD
MSSDYIPRLRAELLRAGAKSTARRRVTRRVLAPLAVAALVAAVVLALPQRDTERTAEPNATVRLEYPLRDEAMVPALRERLAAAGVAPATVTASAGRLSVIVPTRDRDLVPALLEKGELAVYDWEASVLGPDGRPAPTDAAVTGGPDAGRSTAVSKAEADRRAAKHPRAVVVRSGYDSERWFALAGPPALTNADLAAAKAGTDPSIREPIVELRLTAGGERGFRDLTRTLAQRGADNALGGDPMQTSQHFAIVVDGCIVSVPFVNWRENPDGIDGGRGLHIAGGLTTETANELAAILSAGPLP